MAVACASMVLRSVRAQVVVALRQQHAGGVDGDPVDQDQLAAAPDLGKMLADEFGHLGQRQTGAVGQPAGGL